MRHLILMVVLFLTACQKSETVFVTQPLPEELTREVVVVCEPGETLRALGECAMALREGLDTANDKLKKIHDITRQDSDKG